MKQRLSSAILVFNIYVSDFHRQGYIKNLYGGGGGGGVYSVQYLIGSAFNYTDHGYTVMATCFQSSSKQQTLLSSLFSET